MVKTAEQMTASGDPDLALKLLWSASLQCWFSDPDAGTRTRVVDLQDRLPKDEHDPRRLAVLAFAAPVERGAEVMARMPHMASLAYHDAGAARVVGTAATAVGAFDVAAELLGAAAAGLRTQGRLGLLARALTLQSWSAAHRVDLNVGIPVAEEAERLARETGQPLITAVAQATQAMLAGLRGDSATAHALATAAERVAMPIRARAVLAAVQHARAIVALAGGRHADAYEHLRRLHDRADPSYHYFMRCFSVCDLAEAAVHSEQGAAVAPIIAELEAMAAETPSPLLLAGLAYARAVLAGDHACEADFESAARATSAWPFLRARTDLAWGMWHRRRRHMTDSRAPLRAARDAFEALGTAPWSERARQELRASGEQSRRRTPDARDELSAQELQIAHMAADGLTNREIGQRLFLSHRTVSSHLYRIYPKLSITSRSELANALAGATALPNEVQSPD
jgi:DNA-binding CsgD family transcriptional regulator